MKLIVGLGNPGEKYIRTRHNAGFVFADYLAAKMKTESWEKSEKFNSLFIRKDNFIIVKPQTYMNTSGLSVQNFVNYYKIPTENLYVVHDDLDISLGQYKIQLGTGPKLHNGIESIEESLGKKEFWRIRVGVDNRTPENRIPGEEYVLQNFTEEESNDLKRVIEKISVEFLGILLTQK